MKIAWPVFENYLKAEGRLGIFGGGGGTKFSSTRLYTIFA